MLSPDLPSLDGFGLMPRLEVRDGSARCCCPMEETAGAEILGMPLDPGPKLDEASISASPSLGVYASALAEPAAKSGVAGPKNALEAPPSSARRDNEGKVEVRGGAEGATDGSEDDCEAEAFSRSLSRSLSRLKGLLASEGRRRKVEEFGREGVGRLTVRPSDMLRVLSQGEGGMGRRCTSLYMVCPHTPLSDALAPFTQNTLLAVNLQSSVDSTAQDSSAAGSRERGMGGNQ